MRGSHFCGEKIGGGAKVQVNYKGAGLQGSY